MVQNLVSRVAHITIHLPPVDGGLLASHVKFEKKLDSLTSAVQDLKEVVEHEEEN